MQILVQLSWLEVNTNQQHSLQLSLPIAIGKDQNTLPNDLDGNIHSPISPQNSASLPTLHPDQPNQVYGLQCPNPKCAKISSYEKITLVCPWCGTSLAGAASSILPLP